MHVVWLRNLLSTLEKKQEEKILIRVDSKLAIELGKNHVNHERSKRIDVQIHFIRKRKIKEESMELEYIGS